MASLNQLVSEVANKYGQPTNHALKEEARSIIVHLRNQEIRRSYTSEGYTDQVLKQGYSVDINDKPEDTGDYKIYKTLNKVLKPVRLKNNIPFHTVCVVADTFTDRETLCFVNAQSVKYFIESSMNRLPFYTYIDEYIYLFVYNNYLEDDDEDETISAIPTNIKKIYIESVFEKPEEIYLNENGELTQYFDDYEYFIPDDMIPAILNIIYSNHNLGANANQNYLINGDNAK